MSYDYARDARRYCAGVIENECGQSTLEYAIVLFAFLSMVIALITLWHAARSGLWVQAAVDAASHALRSGFATTFKDVLLY